MNSCDVIIFHFMNTHPPIKHIQSVTLSLYIYFGWFIAWVVGWLESSWGGWVGGAVGGWRVHGLSSGEVGGWRVQGEWVCDGVGGGGGMGGWRVNGVGVCVIVWVVMGWVVGGFMGWVVVGWMV